MAAANEKPTKFITGKPLYACKHGLSKKPCPLSHSTMTGHFTVTAVDRAKGVVTVSGGPQRKVR